MTYYIIRRPQTYSPRIVVSPIAVVTSNVGGTLQANALGERALPEKDLSIMMFAIVDEAVYTTSSDWVTVDWSFVNLAKLLPPLGIDPASITKAWFYAQLAVSAGTGYLAIWNYTKNELFDELSTTENVKSNRVVKELDIAKLKQVITDGDVLCLRIRNDPGGIGYATFLGKAELIIRYIG